MAHQPFSRQPSSPLLPTPSARTSRPKSTVNVSKKPAVGNTITSYFQKSALNPPVSTSSPSAPSPATQQSNPASSNAPRPPDPYPGPISPLSTPHPHITIDPIRTVHIASLARITGLLLPVRYSSSFFSETITDPLVASVSRVAVCHDHPVSTEDRGADADVGASKVIGGIRCRLEPIPLVSLERGHESGPVRHNMYIQTLHLLSPYRGQGVAAALLESVIYEPLAQGKSRGSGAGSGARRMPSLIAQHYNIRTVTAHVHEANDEALHWYESRGFEVLPGTVEGYYRRLNPSGAKVVQLKLDWDGECEYGYSDVLQSSDAGHKILKSS